MPSLSSDIEISITFLMMEIVKLGLFIIPKK